MQLSQKEKQLLQDQKAHEQVCIQKYQQYAQQSSDPQLKQLFQTYAQQEQQHLNTIESVLNGQVPSMNQGQQSQQQSQSNQSNTTMSQSNPSSQTNNTQSQNTSTATTAGSPSDAMLCHDMLMTEKYVSGAYDTAIFEFSDASIRQALNHIQKEEQQHGEGIFNYMSSNGMYK